MKMRKGPRRHTYECNKAEEEEKSNKWSEDKSKQELLRREKDKEEKAKKDVEQLHKNLESQGVALIDL